MIGSFFEIEGRIRKISGLSKARKQGCGVESLCRANAIVIKLLSQTGNASLTGNDTAERPGENNLATSGFNTKLRHRCEETEIRAYVAQ